MPLKERIAASVLIASLTFGGAGCQDINATKPTTTVTETTPSSTTPTTETTIETTPSTTETTKPTTEITTTPTTTETQSELSEVPPERLQFTKDLLNLYDKTDPSSNMWGKIRNLLTRDQIIEIGKTGEYSDIENFSIINHKDGSPAIAMINCQDNVVTSFKKAIKEMEEYDPNYLKLLTDNGILTFTVNRYNETVGNTYTFNEDGQFIWNVSKERLEKEDLSHALKNKVLVESYGIKFLNLGEEYARHVGFYKEGLSAYCWWNLYCKTGLEFCKEMAYSDYMMAKDFYGKEYKMDFNSTTVQSAFDRIFNEGLVDFFGGTGEEINENRKTMPDWNPGDIK